MIRDYVRVTPTTSQLDPETISTALASLHKLSRTHSTGLKARLKSALIEKPPTFEFVALSAGEHESVEFYYGAEDCLDVLETRLRSIYPASFDVERVHIDLVKKLLTPVEYSLAEFNERLSEGRLYVDPPEGNSSPLDGENPRPNGTMSLEDDGTGPSDELDVGTPGWPESADGTDLTVPALNGGSPSRVRNGEIGDEWSVLDSHSETEGGSDAWGGPSTGFDDGSSVASDPDEPLGRFEGPTRTREGTILARPSLDEVTPYGVQWRGSVDRRMDWMTTLTPFSEHVDGEPRTKEDDRPGGGTAPLAPLVDQLTEVSHPLAFQVVFERKPDWSKRARRRSGSLLGGADTLLQQVLSVESSASRLPGARRGWTGGFDGRRQAVRWDGSATSTARLQDREKQESVVTRLDLLRENTPGRTFAVNVRALGLLSSDEHREDLEAHLDALCTVFDPVDGPYYEIQGERFRRRGVLPGAAERRARFELERFMARSVYSRRRDRLPRLTNQAESRPDLVLNPAELANFVVVPSAADLTVEGSRGVRAEQRSRNPLPRPNPDITRCLRGPGLDLGFLLGENRDRESDPLRLSPALLPFHVGRFAKTGAGKSIALINDALSLVEHTDGPIFLIDTKGGGLPEQYMRAHATRFGFEHLEANVLHFEVPDILPGFAFFNIEPALANGIPRLQAVKDRVDHYEEVLKMTMGEERYEQAVVSPNLLKYLIRLMYDEEHGLDHGAYRESVDYFGQSQLEQVVDQLYHAGPPQPAPEEAPQSSTEEVTSKIHRHLNADPRTFANIMGGVSNRMDYITADPFLRQIFDTTEPRFDIRQVLDEDVVVIFDLGNLRMDAAKVMAGVILTNLYDAVTERGPAELAATPDEYVVNLLIDEAASVVVSQILNDLLEKGREFQLSVELVSQFPEQMQFEGDRQVYLNVLNNIGAPIVGKIAVDDEIARALAHEDMDPVEFRNRVRALPRGEWIAQVPSPVFGETGPMPFSIAPMPIPPGHPEGDAPLTPTEEARFQQALDRVNERTLSEYGVPVDATVPTARVPASIQETLALASDGVDELLAVMTRYVQLREGVRETNGWVPVEDVDDLLETWYETSFPTPALGDADGDEHRDVPSRADLAEIREHSPLFELSIDTDRGVTVMRLTETGAEVSATETGAVQAAGGAAHDDALERVEAGLTRQGNLVAPVRQDGSEQPDAWAVHPDAGVPLAVEVETTTHTKPSKVLTNLGRAQGDGALPVFVVPGEGNDGSGPGTLLAERVRKILADPVKDRRTDGVELYTASTHVTFNGGATSENGVTAVRPVSASTGTRSNRNQWLKQEDEYVLTDETGTEHARVTDVAGAPKAQFPATYSLDQESGTYTVTVPGELPRSFDSKEAFRERWEPVKSPFVPEVALSVPDYGPETYAILVLDDGSVTPRSDGLTDELVVYREGELESLEWLTEALRTGDLRPASTGTEEHAAGELERLSQADGDGTESGPNESDGEPGPVGSRSAESPGLGDGEAGVATFASACLVDDPGNVIPFREVYDVYEGFVDAQGFETVPANHFTRILKEQFPVESTRKWLDGKARQCYVDVGLAAGSGPQAEDGTAGSPCGAPSEEGSVDD